MCDLFLDKIIWIVIIVVSIFVNVFHFIILCCKKGNKKYAGKFN